MVGWQEAGHLAGVFWMKLHFFAPVKYFNFKTNSDKNLNGTMFTKANMAHTLTATNNHRII